MYARAALSLALVILATRAWSQSRPPSSRAKQVAGKIADTTVTSAAAFAADSLLGKTGAKLGGLMAGAAGAGSTSCTTGLVAIPASLAGTATSPAATPSIPTIPTPGGLLIGAAKRKLLGKKPDTSAATSAASGQAAAASPGAASTNAPAQTICVTPEQAHAYTAAYQSQAAAGTTAAGMTPGQAQAAQQAAIKSGVGAALSVTPPGMLVTGAVAAAPVAAKGVRALGGLLGRGGDTKESIIRDLAKGRAELKGIRFIEGTDILVDGFEPTVALLAEAIQALEGQYVMRVPAESDGKSSPDTALARRRMTRLAAQLQVNGIPASRLSPAESSLPPNEKSRPPKPGQARVEILRATEQKP